MKKTFLLMFAIAFSTHSFADTSCRVYFDELALLKTVKSYEVDHHRYEQIQLLENNLYRKGYVFTNHRESANFQLESFDVGERENKCADASLLLTDVYKGKSAVTQGVACSKLSFIPNTSALNAAKEAIRKLPDCRKF